MAFRGFASVLVIGAVACANGGPADELTGKSGSTLTTPEVFPDGDPSRACSLEEQTFIRKAMRAGRIIAESPAFRACLGAAMIDGATLDQPEVVGDMSGSVLGPYFPCDEHGQTDPPIDGSLAQQRAGQFGRVLAAAQTRALAVMYCDPKLPPEDVAKADAVYDVGNGPEGWTFQKQNLDDAIAAGKLGFIAAAAWHEAMHQHGYHHATGTAAACGYQDSSDPTWMLRHTVPYVVEMCVWQVFEHSAEACARVRCDNDAQLALDDAYVDGGDPVCRCFDDPAAKK